MAVRLVNGDLVIWIGSVLNCDLMAFTETASDGFLNSLDY